MTNDELCLTLSAICLLPERSVWIIGGEFNAEIAFRGVGEASTIIGFWEDTVGEAWSAYTDHNPVEVKLAKGWVYRAPPRTPRRIRRPNWVSLRGSGDAAQVARSALATELDRRAADEQPTTWPEVVSLGLGVSRAGAQEGSSTLGSWLRK